MNRSKQKRTWTTALVVILSGVLWSNGSLQAQDEPPPLPLHGIEGSGGVFSTYTAYLVNPAREGKVFGLPSLGEAYVSLGNGRHLSALTLTETLWDRLELGYAFDYFTLGDLPEDIKKATGISIDDDAVKLHNFNARLLLLKENSFEQPWLPALTAGVHYKYNENIDDIDDDLFGTLEAIGIEDNSGVDFTLTASKLITALPRPVLVSAGLRSTEAAHLGLLGFTDDRTVVGEGHLVVFATDRLLVGGEYRQKPSEYRRIPGLVEKEDDWWTLVAAYLINDHLTVSGGYGHFGDVLNHEADQSFGIKAKWEF